MGGGVWCRWAGVVARERVAALELGPAGMAPSEMTGWCCLPGEAEVDLAFDVGPFFGLSQPSHQFFEGRCVLGGELKPGQEVEGFSEVTAAVQPPRDRGEVFKPGGDVTVGGSGAQDHSLCGRTVVSGMGDDAWHA